MTRIALLSDVHGNLPALESVLRAIASRDDVVATYHLGDLVGYGAWPNEVVEMIRARGITGVSGNYDSTVANAAAHCGCRSENARHEELAHESFAWTCAHVTPDTKQILAALPFRLDVRPLGGHVAGPTLVLVHATPVSNLVYVTADRSDEFLSKMASQAGVRSGDVVCFGHTHLPWQRVVDGVTFVNTGSVGRPKDGDARAAYVVLDVSHAGVQVEIVRVVYDVESAARGVVAAGLPTEFAEFLRKGGG